MRGASAFMIVAAAGLSCAGGDPEGQDAREVGEEVQVARPPSGTPEDWRIARGRVEWAKQAELDTVQDFGEVLARIGETFVGTPYEPHTLEYPGEEELVINLEVLDCVTFVENVLTLGRLTKTLPSQVLSDSALFRGAFERELAQIRYRTGTVDGYASRLHYFSEWMTRNHEKGIVRHVSEELGGVVDPTPVNFMSTHPDAYGQLADPNVLAAVVQIEAQLGRTERFFIPEDQIAEKAELIRTGDVIAATSTVAGLDVAHTGIALWRDGELRLLHAPLVGSEVQLSDEPLAERIRRIPGQDGIMVARPVAPGPR